MRRRFDQQCCYRNDGVEQDWSLFLCLGNKDSSSRNPWLSLTNNDSGKDVKGMCSRDLAHFKTGRRPSHSNQHPLDGYWKIYGNQVSLIYFIRMSLRYPLFYRSRFDGTSVKYILVPVVSVIFVVAPMSWAIVLLDDHPTAFTCGRKAAFGESFATFIYISNILCNLLATCLNAAAFTLATRMTVSAFVSIV